MPIKFRCPSCEKVLTVNADARGRKVRCNGCSSVIRIPAGNGSAATEHRRAQAVQGERAADDASDTTPSPQRARRNPATRDKKKTPSPIPQKPDVFRAWLKKAFRSDTIEQVPVTWSYRIAILVVGIVMVGLVLGYVALIAGIPIGTYFVASALLRGESSPVAMVGAGFLMLSAGGVFIFLLKPFFSKPPHTHGRRTLHREDEPILFEFVEHICDIVEAPYPTQIDIDCTINAAAAFYGGVAGLWKRELTLNIGMSLVAGLNVRQFAGVLAHEFGHFSQGTGMRVSYLIRVISHWFTRVVYERDVWDERLASFDRSNGLLALPLLLVRFGVWISRKVLWLFMIVGHTVSGFLLRQMEFDADRYEFRVAGSGNFAETSWRMTVLQVAHQGALDDLQQFYKEGRLGDDLPQLIVLNVPEIPGKVLKKVKKAEEEATTGMFDTHPCVTDRIENSEQEEHVGIIGAKNPAQQLFRKFEMRSRAVTMDFYTEIFGDELKKKLIRPVAQLVEFRRIYVASLKSLRRFFRGHFSWYRRLSLPADIWETAEANGELRNILLSNRQETLNCAAKYGPAWKKYSKAEGQQVEAKLARTLIAADFDVPSSAFSLPLTTRGQISRAVDKLGVRQGKAEPALRAFEEAAAERLSFAVKAARSEAIAPKLKKRGFAEHEMNELLQVYMLLNESVPQLVEIHDQQMILGKLMELLSAGFQHDAILGAIHEQMEFLYDKISLLHKSFLQCPYPFDHRRANISLAEYMLKERRLPKYSDPFELYSAADGIAQSLPEIQARVLGRLCEFAEAVETAAGLSPMEDLPDDAEEESEADE